VKKWILFYSLWVLFSLSLSAQEISGSTTLIGAANPIEKCESSYSTGAFEIGMYKTGDTLVVSHVCRTWFQFDLSTIPAGATLKGVTVNYTNGGGSYTFKLTKLASVNPGNLQATWTAIGNSTSLQSGLPYGGSPFSSSSIMTFIKDNLSSKVMYIGALSENETAAGSQSGMSLKLDVTYTYPAAKLTLLVQNDLDGNGTGGSIGVSISPAPATPRTSPYLLTAYENNKLNLEAYLSQ
jgi:hypothetical protein